MIYLHIISILLAFGLSGKGDNPPGTKKVSEKFYVDEAEVRNIDWREYLYWEKRVNGDSSEQYLNAIPDSSYWKCPELTFKEYYTNPKYNKYPVVCISYTQAVNYCKWRSDRVNENLYRKKNKISYQDKLDFTALVIPKEVTYRLITPEEWEKLAVSDGTSKSVFAGKGTHPQQDCSMKFDVSGFCDLAGNVSEMTSKEGVAKGCSFLSQTTDFNVKTDVKYTTPAFWLGFRCACETAE